MSLNMLKNAFNPMFYHGAFRAAVEKSRANIKAGSPAPIFKLMIIFGGQGFVLQYVFKERTERMEKRAVVDKALEGFHH